MPVKRSDVVMTHPHADADTRARHGATFVAWGFLPSGARVGDANLVNYWKSVVDGVHKSGLRFQGRVELDAGWTGMIDLYPEFMEHVCRTLDGEPIRLPWFWDKTHKGHPAYWFCTNSSGFREFMKRQIEMALSADLDSLMLDAQTCTMSTLKMGGCFCQSCMAGFRKFLGESAEPAELAGHGISELDEFDYGEFLRDRGVTVEKWRSEVRSWSPTLPLAQEYISFQYMGATGMVDMFYSHAQKVAGRPIAISASGSMTQPARMYAVPRLSFFCVEAHHEAGSLKPPKNVLFSYKLAEALGRPMVCTGLPQQDWSVISAGNRRGLVRLWIAQAYAFGANFMVPTKMWCYDLEKGTHWYQSAPGDYDYLYKFVRENAALFDGYDAAANVALLYSHSALRNKAWRVRQAGINLALANVPFRLVVAGDDWLPARITADQLAEYRNIVVTEPTHLDAEQQAVLDTAKRKVVVWSNFDQTPGGITRDISLAGAKDVMLVPRTKRADPRAPFVCHMVNRNYLPDTDSMEVQKGFTVTIADSLFGTAVQSAKLRAPGRETVECKVRRMTAAAYVTIPELDVWAILELE